MMSVFTKITPEAAQDIAKSFGLSHVTWLSPILHGTQNSNYWLTTTEGEFVLTLVEELDRTVLANIFEFCDYLNQKGIPCLVPLKNKTGDIVAEFQTKPVMIIQKLLGAQLDSPLVSHAEKVGGLLADLHQHAATYTGPRLADSRGKHWRHVTQQHLTPYLTEQEKKILEKVTPLEMALNWESLPTGMIHADLFTDNILWDDDHISGVLDFFFACEGAYLYDLAILLNDWCFSKQGEFKPEHAEALLTAYLAKRPLSAEENAAWHTVCSVAALRFWLSRRLALQSPSVPGDVTQKDPLPFLKIMQFHLEGGVILPAH